MHILFVESQDDKAVLVIDKLGARNCSVTRAKGLIEAAGLVGLKPFDLVLISDLGKLAPINALINRLRKTDTPYAYLVPKEKLETAVRKYPNVTVDELDNGVLDKLIHAGV
jgi:DNA-binding response OmpR family regulator